MKIIGALSLLLLVSLITTSCKKDDTTATTTTSAIVGKWSLVSDTTKDDVNPANAGSYTGVSTDYWDFRADGMAYVREDIYTDTFPYKVLPDNKMLFGVGIGSDTVSIIKLTAAAAVIAIPLPPTSTQYVYLKK